MENSNGVTKINFKLLWILCPHIPCGSLGQTHTLQFFIKLNSFNLYSIHHLTLVCYYFSTLFTETDTISLTKVNKAQQKYVLTDSALEFWLSRKHTYPKLAPLAQDLISAPASQTFIKQVISSMAMCMPGNVITCQKSLK